MIALWINISTNDGVPIYMQIVQQVKYQVASGRLVPGAQLPSLRNLAQQLCINPNTVARAYRELETSGVITTRPGAGIYVAQVESPLSTKEKMRILRERTDLLLTEAKQMGVDLDAVIDLARRRSKELEGGKPGS